MSLPAIRVEGLSKEYVIDGPGRAGLTFREAVIDSLAAPFRRRRGGNGQDGPGRRFWALKDIAFEIEPGEVVGIIGRNGAGKSTLLKILSRITAPTRGRIEIQGRIASLLEVGTGFHPELTGRENIRLNGAILGMSGVEIRAKFDEIVEFSGVESFIDTPVKRYSSGMQVRLAFAVAAHLEPEILLVDEVLSVGDAEFQKKCLGKMGELSAKGGRTVLFVSHQLGIVARLCERAILLSGGLVVMSGRAREAIDRYVSEGATTGGQTLITAEELNRTAAAVASVRAISKAGDPTSDFAFDEPVRIIIEVEIKERVPGLCLGVAIQNRLGVTVTTWVSKLDDLGESPKSRIPIGLTISPDLIAPGGYSFAAALFVPNGKVHHRVDAISPIIIHDTGSAMSAFHQYDYGVVVIPATWSINRS